MGRDPRLSGPALGASIFAGLASAGVHPVDLGLCTTPACFVSTITPGYAYDGAIMLTASHLPWRDASLNVTLSSPHQSVLRP